MPAEPATWPMFKKRLPPGPREAAAKAPQAQRMTSGLTPGVMPAFRPATTMVLERSAVTRRPKAMALLSDFIWRAVGVGGARCWS